ncbi:MAG: MBL fold metallo-hydrolase, partial [Thermodesulfobacteriota bacterium]
MFFKQIILDESGALSYFIGCPKARKACVVNPRRDIQEYIDTAAQFGMQITQIMETAGFEARKSGRQALAAITGAEIWFLEPGEKLGGKVVKDGALFRFGDAEVRVVRETRYSPFAKSLLVIDRSRPDKPWLILTRRCLYADNRINETLSGKNAADELVDAI